MAVRITSLTMEAIGHNLASLPNATAENEIARALRNSTPEDRDATIFSILSSTDPSVRLAGLRIAKRIHDTGVALKIVSLGLDRGDAYEIRLWLQSASGTIGVKKTLSLVAEYASKHPGIVVKYWYGIRALIGEDTRDVESMIRLAKVIDDRIDSLSDSQRDYWSKVRPEGPLT